MDAAAGSGTPVDVVQYLKTPPDRAELQEIIDKLEDPVADLVRKDGFFKDLGLDAADYTTPDAVIGLLLEHPRLMQRPVLVRSDRAIIGRPKDRVEPFLRGD
jgi:arsenate reductase